MGSEVGGSGLKIQQILQERASWERGKIGQGDLDCPRLKPSPYLSWTRAGQSDMASGSYWGRLGPTAPHRRPDS